MTTRDYTANVISATKVVPDGNFKTSAASGVWDINEALDLIKGGNWPNAANIDPATFVDGLFQTHVYNGTGAEQTITNDINLSGKGGLVWIKLRTTTTGFTFDNHLFDTERGALKRIRSNRTNAESTYSNSLTSFNSNGFTLGSDSSSGNVNYGSGTNTYVSWTFREQPKFFDVVTYTGTGSAQAIAHNLGSVPGMIIIKSTDVAYNWGVFHRSLGNTKALILDATNASDTGSSYWNNTDPTSTHFTVGTDNTTNASDGGTYVAYLFAHNNDDGGFGEPGDQDIIKCGSYTGNETNPNSINLGFEPQWIMVKAASKSQNWFIVDVMRGITTGGDEELLSPNTNGAKSDNNYFSVTPTGFNVENSGTFINETGQTYIYMAIRRGGMQTPTTASDVFAIDNQTASSAPFLTSNFPVDMVLRKDTAGGNSEVMSRLTQGKALLANSDGAESSDSVAQFDFNDGCLDNTSTDTSRYGWMWKRARGYFDVVTYTGNNTLRTINHNLGVVPEMMWLKRRNSADIWTVYHSALGEGKRLKLHQNTAAEDDLSSFNNTAPTSTVFTINQNVNQLNADGSTYIVYLFATAAGVSKIGSYTGNGNATGPTVDCGFTNGTKFVLLKRTSGLQNWYFYDTTRGLTSGDDKELELNSTSSERTGQVLNSTTSGFQLATSSTFANENGSTFIFYAIANDPS